MLPALTALRFFAATAVFLEHVNVFTGSGTVAVQFFFVLSGFILAYNYGESLRILNGRAFSHFMILRLGRIYPVYFLTFLLSATFIHLSQLPNLRTTVLHLFMLQSILPIGDKVFAYDRVSWSVSDEMFFYTLFPLAIFLLHRLRVTASGIRLFVLWILLYALAAGVTYHYRGRIQAFSFGWWLTYISPQFRFLGFLMGVAAGFVFLRIKDMPPLRTTNRAIFTFLEAAAIGSVVIPYYAPWYNFILSPYLPAFSLAVLVFAFGRGMISAFLADPLLIYLGEISYSIYLLHPIVLDCAGRLFKGSMHRYTTAWQIGLFLIVLCLSNVVYRYCEFPARNLARALVKKSGNKSLGSAEQSETSLGGVQNSGAPISSPRVGL